MKSHFLNSLEKIRTSLWFVPGSLVALGITVAVVCLSIDFNFDLRKFLPSHGPATARGAEVFLSTIGGGLLGITGVSFSITIVTLTLASSQFGPRLIRNFMRSASTQLVLGGMLGSVVCILIFLGNLDSKALGGAPPRLSLLVSIGLAVFCIALFVYFLHHIAVSIQADRVVAGVFEEIEETLARLFPDSAAESDRYEADQEVPFPDRPAATLTAPRDGYLQAIEIAVLLDRATSNHLVVHVQPTPGSFVLKGSVLAALAGPGVAEFSPEARADLSPAFILGGHRTPTQDFEFSIRQLVEIGLRALSPSINDPFTAINCIDYLAATISRIAQCGLPRTLLHDENGNLRVSLNTTRFEGIVKAAFSQLTDQAADRIDVSLHLLRTAVEVAHLIERHDYRPPVVAEARRIVKNLQSLPGTSHLHQTIDNHLADLDQLDPPRG